ncbi:hypothetical protein OPT61_g9579 [Boeremia exigua]|uniref:Uncharacterized protein n=1 Tax=Boeremia exigua TaxID=749465 RepID=A0ACC2HTL9_9PLEO|nr:hypothetical protein OPT61_g9579 [Boeremia exigua]
MFYEGTLQSGIGQAIQQQKLVACFIRDDGAASKQWEDEWLRSGWLSSLLEQKAVLLRLESGSTEAGFLAAFSAAWERSWSGGVCQRCKEGPGSGAYSWFSTSASSNITGRG